jgi:hypothetical protein
MARTVNRRDGRLRQQPLRSGCSRRRPEQPLRVETSPSTSAPRTRRTMLPDERPSEVARLRAFVAVATAVLMTGEAMSDRSGASRKSRSSR